MATYDPQAIRTYSAPNFWPGRMNYKPRYIILHGTAGGAGGGALSWLCKPGVANGYVSAHYVITQNGAIYQLVDEENAAWANGGPLEAGHAAYWSNDINPNLISISIEHEKPDTGNATPLTSAQMMSSFQLISRICARWGIPARAADALGGVTGHFSISPESRANCPGAYDWNGLWSFLKNTHGSDVSMLSLNDPMGNFFSDRGGNRWHCAQTNVDVAYAHLDFYRQHGGAFGLPLTNEMTLSAMPGSTIQIYERAIAIYDPQHKYDSQPGAGAVYLLHIDSGVGRDIIAKPLVTKLNQQLAQAQAAAQTGVDVAALKQAVNNLQSLINKG